MTDNTINNNTINNIVIYQSESGAIALRSDNALDTIWATQKQMAELFDVNVPAITKHIDNIYNDGELDSHSTLSKMEIVQTEGSRQVTRDVIHYNLDMIISVGYRVHSGRATHFRKWATSILRDHITRGYTVNTELLNKRKTLANDAIHTIRLLSEDSELINKSTVLDLIQGFTHTWFSLQRYDSDNLPKKGTMSKTLDISSDALYHDVETLKQSLITQGQATPLFRPKTESRYFHKIPTFVGMTTPDLNERNPVIPSQDGISSYLLDTVSGTV